MSDVRVFSFAELADCAKRELGWRRVVYPRRVIAGSMTQHKADGEIAKMEAIERLLRDAEQRKERLL